MCYISADSHSQASCKRFEDAFYLVVLVLTFCLDVQIHRCAIGQTLEEVQKHFCWHLANFLAMELGIPHQPRPSAKVEGNLTKAIIHRQAIAITLYATLVAKSFADTFAQSQRHIFDCMMLINLEVAITTDV